MTYTCTSSVVHNLESMQILLIINYVIIKSTIFVFNSDNVHLKYICISNKYGKKY